MPKLQPQADLRRCVRRSSSDCVFFRYCERYVSFWNSATWLAEDCLEVSIGIYYELSHLFMGGYKDLCMNKTINLLLLVLALSTVTIFGCRCSTAKTDPLAGWTYLLHTGHSHFDKTVVKDYWDYIHNLSPDESRLVDGDSINEYEDSSGNHAVKIEIPVNGTWWEHVIIYDRNNKLINNIKKATGYYAS